jgi:hypothetical protein
MKHLKHMSETVTKTPEKHFENHYKHTQHLDKILQHICVKHMQYLNKHTCNICLKTDEILRTDVCNICVQPLQHMQHSDLLLQHPYETLETYI